MAAGGLVGYRAVEVLARGIVDLLFPPACQICRRPGDFPLCRDCRAQFPLILPPVCRRCGTPMPEPAGSLATCLHCRQWTLCFEFARAAGIFAGTLREALHSLKFNGCRALARPLGKLIAETVAADPRLRADAVMPVPLHPRRYKERGFNQAELLAAEVAHGLHIPLIADVLVRVASTRPQVGLGGAERRPNVRGAFAMVRNMAAIRVLLVDDIMSTGSTASECAKEIKRSGVRSVAVATVALAVLDSKHIEGAGRSSRPAPPSGTWRIT